MTLFSALNLEALRVAADTLVPRHLRYLQRQLPSKSNTNHWILLFFSPIRLNYHIFSRQNLSQISFVDQNVEITQGHLKQVIQLVQIGTIFYEFIRWTQK
ncbi:Hypothetical_protein [Hexamita inflata]|uniref:Hypothetical_protein n=1 Tax=Hexamita inflata TaxID=28002 RepID=A0AA86UXR7_9EUKA|nr:Hypothetical protein HINF_LOCUS56386 [Hexamita inflata]